ncbi:hypothetical protein R1flu_029046 [Riccia fluitans]|uniref:Uncharacterized protein n=1 Tax=Riccia fluitans TaxID=41844 RepID=A0ABD1XP28_9MARC
MKRRFDEANNHQNVQENRTLKTQKPKPKAAEKESKQTKEKAQTKASDDKLQQANEHLLKVAHDSKNFVVKGGEDLEGLYYAAIRREDNDGPADDDAMSSIPIVDLDRNIDSGADLDRLWDALLYARFGVRITSNNNVKEEKPMENLSDYCHLWD